MAVVVLDAGPLGLIAQRDGIPVAEACRAWVAREFQRSVRFVVPAVADYEVRRELIRIGSVVGLRRLDRFIQSEPDRWLPITDAALLQAAEFWARSRNAGTPTGDPKELDCDVLIAAQALSLGLPLDEFVVATTNVGHLGQFVPAKLWTEL